MAFRTEKDTLGEVQVPEQAFYGAQTQRSIQNFEIGQGINTMPIEVVRAFAILKKAAALTNCEAGKLDQEKCDAISKVCDEISAGELDDQFPLVVWQTGSGTQSNMNVNEVIAFKAHVNNGGSLSQVLSNCKRLWKKSQRHLWMLLRSAVPILWMPHL